MAKVDPREETAGRPGPVRTSSGTRAAFRLAPLTPGVSSQEGGANDVEPAPAAPVREEMPTRELDLDQLRAMALRCASDVGADEPGLSPSPPRPRLQLILAEEPERATTTEARDALVAIDDTAGPRPVRTSNLAAAAVVALALALGVVAALAAYGALP